MPQQKPKRWFKKPKVDPSNPNKMDPHSFYMNQPWMFTTKNRDRPTGHMRNSHKNGYENETRRDRFRRNHRYFILEGLLETYGEY